MLTFPKESPWLRDGSADLVTRAAAILAREAQSLPGSVAQAPGVTAMPPDILADIAKRACPVVGATVPLPPANKDQLRQQAHELLAGLFAAFGQASPLAGGSATPHRTYADPKTLTGYECPVTHAAVPLGGFDPGTLQRQAHEFIETLMAAFAGATYSESPPAENRVPHIQCLAPAKAGNDAHATFTIANEEPSPSEVTLYSTNFVAHSGYDIPSLRVSASPRTVTIPRAGRATFEIKIAVPQQTPAGTYSGLIQAMGTKYVKAVLSVEVL
jgi:hypothetical protein